ncbi:mucin-2 [Zeugodacus cucurbitae]|uniref:mucin-2 n=1 Tax=Zeugodacus cucurbitae TaxID=28588 RepID=UPI0005969827|nr:mucin-2 [Zeugodacus cucurbitae]
MIHKELLKCLLLLIAVLLLPAHAFWWAPPTAAPTTESPLALKEIPLTYFRTYTYQPIAGHPFAAFPYYHHAASALQSPLLAGPARYEHGTYMHGSAYPMSVALTQQQQQSQSQQQTMLPPHMYQLPQTPVLHAKPLPSPTTTTTSTTSTEPPTTTSTTTTTTTTTTTPPPPSTTVSSSSTSTTTSVPVTQTSEAQAQPQQLAQHQPQPQPYPYPYPTYNRRAYMGYNPHSYRPAYPYPDYTVYKTAPVTRFNSHGGQIQFVPCMCPVSVGSTGAVRSSLTPEGRTSSDEEEDLMVLARADEMNLPVELGVDTEKTETGTAEAEKSKSETEVTAKTGAESEITENLVQKTTEAVDEQLSTNKIDGQSLEAVELGSDGKSTEA